MNSQPETKWPSSSAGVCQLNYWAEFGVHFLKWVNRSGIDPNSQVVLSTACLSTCNIKTGGTSLNCSTQLHCENRLPDTGSIPDIGTSNVYHNILTRTGHSVQQCLSFSDLESVPKRLAYLKSWPYPYQAWPWEPPWVSVSITWPGNLLIVSCLAHFSSEMGRLSHLQSPQFWVAFVDGRWERFD